MRRARLSFIFAPCALVACGAASDGGAHGPNIDFDASSPIVTTNEAGVADAATSFDAADATADGAPPPATSSAWLSDVIYLVMPDRFFNGDTTNDLAGYPECTGATSANLFHGGDIAGLRQKIGYMKELGVTALWHTPLYKQTPIRNGACGYHGYWADFVDPDDGAMEPKLGTIDEETGLASDLHANGMKLVIDMVVNHPGRNARIVTEHADWFHDAVTCASLGDPNVYCPLNGLPDFAQENPVVAAFLTNVSRGWVSRVMPDGIRMDTAKNVLTSYFATSWTPGVRGVESNLFIVGEVFDTGPYTDFTPVLDAGFDSTFNFPLRAALDDVFAKDGSVDEVADKVEQALATLGLARTLVQTTLLDNHDVPRFMSDAPAGVAPADLAKRYALALTALFTLPGIPQLYAGDELGMLGSQTDTRRDMPSWAWDAAGRASANDPNYLPTPQAVFSLVQSLIAIRAKNAALSSGYYAELWRQNGAPANVLAFYRASGASRAFVVINNGDAASGALDVPFATVGHIAAADRAAWPDGTVLEDQLGLGAPKTITIAGGKIPVTLGAKVAAIYTAKAP
jgi:glycosidase